MKNLEYTNEILEDINRKKLENKRYSRYYFRLSKELNDQAVLSKKIKNRSENILNCLNLWQWDKYDNNKLLDLQKVNRCKNNRFCPNCRKLDLARSIHSFNKPFTDLMIEGNYPYLLTLTIPNCTSNNLEETINLLNKSFTRLWRGFYEDSQNTIKFRELEFTACLKVLEITYNKHLKTYHPHLHCIVFSKQYNVGYFNKCIKGHYSNKRKSVNLHSHADIHIAKIWTMIVDKIRLTEENYFLMSDDPTKLYQVDIREMDESGIYEVLKYTFKDSDVSNYQVFKTLVNALERKRLRQGYGALYNIKFEDVQEGDKQSIDDYLTIEENPTNLLTREIKELVTTYKEYRKISRFTPIEYKTIID